MSSGSVMPCNHLILCHPLLLLLSIFPSIRVFSNESALCIRWPKYWSFSFNISPSNEYSGLISFRIDWLDLVAVQATLKSLLQHHSSKPSILWHSAFFTVQLSHSYMMTGKTTALTRWTFVGKVLTFLEKTKRDCSGKAKEAAKVGNQIFPPGNMKINHPKEKAKPHFASKGLYSQSYGFSISHVQM